MPYPESIHMPGIRQSKLELIKKFRIAGLLPVISLIFAKTVLPIADGSYEYHWLEAEYPNTISALFLVGNNSNASEGLYIYVPNGGGIGAEATYSANIGQTGHYILFGRVYAPVNAHNAFSINIDNGGNYIWGAAKAGAWKWDNVSDNVFGMFNNIVPIIFYLTAGNHTITIRALKDGVKLDKLLLTNNRSFNPVGTGNRAENIITPVCPDAICSGNETCQSCPQDCPCPRAADCSEVTSAIIFCEDFESGIYSSELFTLTCCDYSTEVQNTVVRNGDYALKTTLLYQDKTGWSPQRAEIAIEDSRTGKIGDIRWYAFSVFIPEDYVADDPINREIFFQLLMHPYLNEHQKSPQFDFQIQEETMQIENRYSVDSDPTVIQKEILSECPMSELRGNWTDWIIYAKWSDRSDGRLKVWQNGNLVVDKTGVNSYAGTGNRVFECKFGIYKWSWFIAGRPTLVDKRVIYHDNIRIGSPDATYYDMITN
jgi:hypothetical protein